MYIVTFLYTRNCYSIYLESACVSLSSDGIFKCLFALLRIEHQKALEEAFFFFLKKNTEHENIDYL